MCAAENLEAYFPMKLLDSFSVFDHSLWDEKKSVEEEQKDAPKQLKQLCDFYGLGYNQDIYLSWLAVVRRAMQEQEPWCNSRESSPQIFWMKILSLKDLTIHPRLERLIKSAIVTPLGSSEVNMFKNNRIMYNVIALF